MPPHEFMDKRDQGAMAITRFLELLEAEFTVPHAEWRLADDPEWRETTGRLIVRAAVEAAGGHVPWASVQARTTSGGEHDELPCTCPAGWLASTCPRHEHLHPYARSGSRVPWPPIEAPDLLDEGDG